jgi:hypothetical protein
MTSMASVNAGSRRPDTMQSNYRSDDSNRGGLNNDVKYLAAS